MRQSLVAIVVVTVAVFAEAGEVKWANQTGSAIDIVGFPTKDATCPTGAASVAFEKFAVGSTASQPVGDDRALCWSWRIHGMSTKADKWCRAVSGDSIRVTDSDSAIAYCKQVAPTSVIDPRWSLVGSHKATATRVASPENVTAGSFIAKAAEGEVCFDFHIADGVSIPETRVVTDLCCINTPFGRICSNCPKCEIRDCTKRYYAQICAPDPGEAGRRALETCVPVAAAAALATLICCGPGAATGVFSDTLRACLIAAGQTWANNIRVNLREQSECGPWRNCT